MEDITPKLTFGDIVGYALVYLLWLILALVAMVVILLLRNTLNVVWPLLGWSRWVLRPVDRFSLVFMGLAWLIYVIFCEQYYRMAITEVRYRRMRQRTQPDKPVTLPTNAVVRFLRPLGLDILAQRVLVTSYPPIALAALNYVIQQVASWLLVG